MNRKWSFAAASLLAASMATPIPAAAADVSDWPVVRMEVVSWTDLEEREPEVEAALNEYLASIDAGVQVDLLPIAFGDRATQLTLLLTDTKEPLDLYAWRFYSTVTGLVDNDQVISLEPYREEYSELWELFPEKVYDTCKVDGQQYSLPGADSFGNFQVYTLRKDIAEELGIADRHGDTLTMEEWNEIMDSAEALHPELCFQADTWVLPLQGIDTFGDTAALGCLMNRGYETNEIVNYYASDAFRDYCYQCKEWADKGFMRDDPLNNSHLGAGMMNDGICGGFLFEAYSIEYALSLMNAQITNYDTIIFRLTDAGCDNSCVYNGWQISSTCKNPDAAMKFLSLCYTDENVGRFLALGIEGVTYQVDENGCAWYADGVTADTAGWNMGAPWFYPNECLSLPFETDFAEYYTGMVEFWHDPSVKYSNGMGFVFDNKNVYDQVKACSAIVDEYREALMMGQVDVDEYLTRFNEELTDNGIDEIIAEMQAQFNAFLEAQGEV